MADPKGKKATVIGSGDAKTVKDTDSEEHILAGNDVLKVYVTSEISIRET